MGQIPRQSDEELEKQKECSTGTFFTEISVESFRHDSLKKQKDVV